MKHQHPPGLPAQAPSVRPVDAYGNERPAQEESSDWFKAKLAQFWAAWEEANPDWNQD